LTSIRDRTCVDCGSFDADLPIVMETGTFEGWICRTCDRTRRHKHRRLRRWARRQVRRYVG
jgi:hypothetical protein